MANESLAESFIAKSVQIIVPQPCFDEFFVSYNFFHAQCLKIVLSKGLGFGIILGSILVKVPQILKILRAKSGEGINIYSVLLELVAITANMTYSFAKGFPFSSYGEGVFLAIQTTTIGFLVLTFGGNLIGAMVYVGTYGGIMAYLLSPVVPMRLLEILQSVNMFVLALSRLVQIVSNFRNGSTGQLSAITAFLLFFGSLARIFTSIQETGDNLIVLTYVVASVCNSIIAAQILYYWNVKPKEKAQ